MYRDFVIRCAENIFGVIALVLGVALLVAWLGGHLDISSLALRFSTLLAQGWQVPNLGPLSPV